MAVNEGRDGPDDALVFLDGQASPSNQDAQDMLASGYKPPKRRTYIHDLILDEFARRDADFQATRHEHRPKAVMPSDILAALRPVLDESNKDGSDTTIRRVLRQYRVWTDEHRDAARRELLFRINDAKAANGFASLQRQADKGYPNLKRARKALAQKHKNTATDAGKATPPTTTKRTAKRAATA